MPLTGHEFCRTLLKNVMADVRKVFTAEESDRAWVWEGERKCFAFHGPNKEYLYNLKGADCKWSAMAEGWSQMLDSKVPPEDEDV